MNDWSALRSEHMLGSDEIYLNTGSFGSLHKRTFDDYLEGLREFERNPTMNHPVFWERADEARRRLGPFLGIPAEDLAFTSNVTVSMNMAILGLDWNEGDEILASDSEYSAIDNCIHHAETRHKLVVRRVPLPKSPTSPKQIIDAFAAQITPRTRLLSVCHVYSGTGTILPVAELAALAHKHGAMIAVDGAHAPGQIPLTLEASGCDLYGGNCHKWLCSPKGVGFLYASPEAQDRLHHIVVGHGYNKQGTTRAEDGRMLIGGRPYMWCLDQWGSRDLPSLVATATAVDVQEQIGSEVIAARGRELTAYLRQRLEATDWATCLTSAPGADAGLANSLTAWLLRGIDVDNLRAELHTRFRITTPAGRRDDAQWMRVSTHYYNATSEVDALFDALEQLRAEA
jgi:isopenicillin-N epimerase